MKASFALAAVAILAVPVALAQEKGIALKDAPGRATVENRQTWTAEVTKMINAFGAPIPQNDASAIVEYLTVNYGVAG
jgi:hypothetical protein